MGTRSMTIVMEDNDELVRIYRQMDGYPEGQGLDLAKLCDVKIVNGLGGEQKVANGMGCLAAQIIAGLKDGPGSIYIEKCGGDINDWCEYVYIVRGGVEGKPPTIECSTQPGPWPFNVQKDDHFVFAGTGEQWLKKYGKKPERKPMRKTV